MFPAFTFMIVPRGWLRPGRAVALAVLLPLQAHAAGERKLLESLPAQADESQRYEVSIAPCKGRICPVEVRLRVGERVTDTRRLPWSATTTAATIAPPDLTYGAGETLPQPDAPRVWTTGVEEATVTVAARTYALPDGTPALVVTQMVGFDHLKRQHTVFIARKHKLKRAWSRSEPPGLYWSTVATPPGTGQAVHFSVFFGPTEGDADAAEIRRLVWNAASDTLSEQAVPELDAALAGSHDSVAAAQAERARPDQCLANYWVLDRQQWGIEAPQRYVLVVPTAQASVANAEVERLRSCEPEVIGSVVQVRGVKGARRR